MAISSKTLSDNIQCKRPFVREYECWGVTAMPFPEFDLVLEIVR